MSAGIQLRVGGKYRTRAGYSVEITASDGALFHGLASPGGETTPMSWHPDGLAVAPRESVWASGRFDIAEEVRTPVPRIGGKYRTRAGYVAEILSFNPDPFAVWPWRGTVEIVPGEPQPHSWMLSGRATGAYTDDPADLMEGFQIPETDWVWYGSAGHFSGWSFCLFHLTTKVGAFLVSTVGDYYPLGREGGRKTLSSDPDTFFETMVFKADGIAHPPCGLPDHDGRELDCARYFNCGEATTGHRAMCHKWAAVDPAAFPAPTTGEEIPT